eukprot:1178065-Prorocentrum_minimum.AAC.2
MRSDRVSKRAYVPPDRWECILGFQAYGIVWKAIDKKTRETVALKKIFDAFQNATDAQVENRFRPYKSPRRAVCTHELSLCPTTARRTFREIMFLQEMNNHENIIRYSARPTVRHSQPGNQPSLTTSPVAHAVSAASP